MDKLADIEKRHASHPLRQRDDFEKIAKEFRDKVSGMAEHRFPWGTWDDSLQFYSQIGTTFKKAVFRWWSDKVGTRWSRDSLILIEEWWNEFGNIMRLASPIILIFSVLSRKIRWWMKREFVVPVVSCRKSGTYWEMRWTWKWFAMEVKSKVGTRWSSDSLIVDEK